MLTPLVLMLIGQCSGNACLGPPPVVFVRNEPIPMLRRYEITHEGMDFVVEGWRIGGKITWEPDREFNRRSYAAALARKRAAAVRPVPASHGAPVAPPERPPTDSMRPNPPAPVTRNYGLALDKISPAPKGQEIFRAPSPEARAFVRELKQEKSGATAPLADDSQKLRLTVIGSEADRAPVIRDLNGNGPLGQLRDQVLFQGYSPDAWAVTGVGLPANGKPSIIVQLSTGRVVHRQLDYSGGEQRLAEAIRKINPNYKPELDPGVGGSCPLGFTRDHWPWLLGGALVFGLLVSRPTRKEGVSCSASPTRS